ncbi:MAG: Gx transporter family protein [Elusimicrobiota bacterium]
MQKTQSKFNLSAKNPAIIGIFIAMAAVFQVVEGIFPRPLPWLRLGLGNMIVLVSIMTMGRFFALKVFIGKVFISSFIMGSFLSPGFYLSVSGGAAAWAVMCMLYRPLGKLSPVGVSVSGSLAHSFVQVLVAYLILVRHSGVFYVMPFILISSVFSGWITGNLARAVVPAVSSFAERKIYLISASPRRISIMKSRGVPVVVFPSGAKEENPYGNRDAGGFALRQAFIKLEKALPFLKPPAIALAADTVVECKGKIYLKPENYEEAVAMLKELNMELQSVYTALVVQNLNTGVRRHKVEKSVFKFNMPKDEIKKIADQNLDKAGGYAIQGMNDKYIEWISGSFLNAVGFPVLSASDLIKKVERARPECLSFEAPE